MCFSAQASFTASAVIGAVGLLSCNEARKTRFMFLALIPLMFAIQQFAEGVVWLELGGREVPDILFQASKYIYLSFAFIIWPLWLPFSLFITEKISSRKWLIAPFMILGIFLVAYFISYLPNNTITAEVTHQSIHYSLEHPFTTNEWFLIGIYTVATIPPCFISSTKYVMLFGILSSIAWIASEFYYHANFTSVWCFFCAIVSLFIYLIIKANVYRNH
ncbi:MAG: DUF6629 family protein [Chlamydiota bacterium]